MYVIKVDGEVLHSPEMIGEEYKVYSPKLQLEINKAGSLQFIVPPCNARHDAIKRMKSIVTVEQDGETIFYGRVTGDVTDIYRQKNVYCEGALNFLLDSVQEPLTYDSITPPMFFRVLLLLHNTLTDDEKAVYFGTVSGLPTESTEMKTETYADTLSVLKTMLVDKYGGYLVMDYSDGTPSLSYIKESTTECTQKIEFGVNMVDMDFRIDTADLCTVLLPLGKRVDDKDTTISSVNDGSIYIEDAELIARYGRITKIHTWDDVEDPQELKKLAEEHMAEMKATETLTIKAIDLSECGADVDSIRLGDKVQLYSKPHGFDRKEICTKIELDLENIEESEYTFGTPQESLTAGNASALRRLSSSMSDHHRWLTETDEALNIAVENVNEIDGKMNTVEADFNAANGEIALMAESVDALDGRVSSAEVRINGMDSTITAQAKTIEAKADKIDLQGYVTMEDFEAVEGWTKDFAGESISASNVVAGEGDFDTLVCGQFNGESPAWKGTTVLTGIGTINQSKRYLTLMTADGGSVTLDIVTDVSITPSSSYINYLGKS